MTEIDLQAPGFLYANAKNCKDYTFLMMLKKPAYTKEALGQNPNAVSDADLLFKSSAIADNLGEAAAELAPKAKEIVDKLKAKNQPNKAEVMIAVCTTSKPDNKDPSKREADVQTVTAKQSDDDIELKAVKAFAQPHEWVAYHTAVCFAELKVKGEIPKVTLEVNPKSQPIPMIVGVWEPKAPGQVGAKRYIAGGFGDSFGSSGLGAQFPGLGSWQGLWGQGASGGKVDVTLPAGVEVFQIGLYPRASGTFTLTATAKGITRKIEFGFTGNHPHPGD